MSKDELPFSVSNQNSSSESSVLKAMTEHFKDRAHDIKIISDSLEALGREDMNELESNLHKLGPNVSQPMIRMCGIIKGGAKYIWQTIRSGVEGFADKVKEVWGKIVEAVDNAISAVKKGLGISGKSSVDKEMKSEPQYSAYDSTDLYNVGIDGVSDDFFSKLAVKDGHKKAMQELKAKHAYKGVVKEIKSKHAKSLENRRKKEGTKKGRGRS